MATVDEFRSLDVRVGTVVSAEVNQGARKRAFWEYGLTPRNRKTLETLVGLQVVAIVNFPPRQVAGVSSEVLVLAVDNGRGEHVLLMPERPVPDGGRVS